MADKFVQTGHGTGTTTASVTLNGVVAGNTLVATLADGSTVSPVTFTVSDGQASYTAKGTNLSDATDAVIGGQFVLVNANAGTHVVTGTGDSGNAMDLWVTEIGTSAGSSSIGGTNQQKQAAPGTGTDAISSTACAVNGASTVYGITLVSSDTNVADEPTQGTGFTSRSTGLSNGAGLWTLQTGAFSSNQAATFTAPNATAGAQTFLTFAMSISNGSAVAVPVGGFVAPRLLW